MVTCDSTGRRRSSGGDPVTVELLDSAGRAVTHRGAAPTLHDAGDGSYRLQFTAVSPGLHTLRVRIFDHRRQPAVAGPAGSDVTAGTCPLVCFTAHQYQRPVVSYSAGALHQPVAVALDDVAALYVLDTGNSRIVVYNTSNTAAASARSTVDCSSGGARASSGDSGGSRAHSSSAGSSVDSSSGGCRASSGDSGGASASSSGGCRASSGDSGGSRASASSSGGSRASSGDSGGAQPVRCIVNDALAGRAATGMCLVRVGGHAGSVGGPALLLYVVNWRTRRVSSVCPASGQLLRSFTCAEFVEPTALAVVAPSALSPADDAGSAAAVRIFVADNGARRLLVFSGEGRLVDSVALDRDEATALSPDHPRDGGGGAATGALVTCLYAVPPPAAEILVCSDRLRALSYAGEFLYELTPGNASPGQVRAGGRGQYGGVVVDARGRYLASRCRQRCGLLAVIEIYSSERRWMFNIECDSPRLRRPAGLAVHCHPADVSAAAAAAAAGGPHSGGDDDDDDAWWVVASSYVYVADLGNNAVRKFRYA